MKQSNICGVWSIDSSIDMLIGRHLCAARGSVRGMLRAHEPVCQRKRAAQAAQRRAPREIEMGDDLFGTAPVVFHARLTDEDHHFTAAA